MSLVRPAKLIDRRANTKRCNDFAEGNCKRGYAGTSEAVTRGEDCDARWLGSSPSRQRLHASLAPSDGYHHSHCL